MGPLAHCDMYFRYTYDSNMRRFTTFGVGIGEYFWRVIAIWNVRFLTFFGLTINGLLALASFLDKPASERYYMHRCM